MTVTRRLRAAAAVAALGLSLTACSDGPGRPRAATVVAQDPAVRAKDVVAKMSDEQLVGQVLMPYAFGADAEHVSAGSRAGNQKLAGVDTPAEMIRRYHLGGLILVSFSADDPTAGTNPTTNVDSPAQVRRLTDGLRAASGAVPPLIGTDQEYGVVTRIRDGVAQLPPAMGLGAAHDPGLTEHAWATAGAELAALGINVDFAPDADVTGGAANAVIGSRSFGSDPAAVGEQTAMAVRGLQSAGVAAAPKHFPGHGHTAVDSHTGLPVLGQGRAVLDAQDLAPFRRAVAAGTWMLMSGHLDTRAIDPGTPASLSRKVLTDVLRGQLHYDGVVVTDALNMGALTDRYRTADIAVDALLAGNDLLLMPPDLPAAQQALLGALRSGRLPRERLVEAATRVMTLRLRLAGHGRPSMSTVDSPTHRDVAARAAARAVTLLRGRCTGPQVTGPVRVTSSKGNEQRAAWLAADLRAAGVPVADNAPTRIHVSGYGDGPADLVPGAAVTVGTDTPYVLAASSSPVIVAAFGGTREAMRAVARVLAGAATATGRSPVAVGALPRSAC